MSEPKRRVVAGDGRRRHIQESDCRADWRRSEGGEGDLSNRQGRASDENTHDERADGARAAVECGEAGGEPCEEGKCVHCEREQQPAEEADAENARNDADDDHSGDLRDNGSNGRAFHHHHGAIPGIADPIHVWNPPWSGHQAREPSLVPEWVGVSARRRSVPAVALLAGWELRLVKNAIAIGVFAIEQRPGRFQSASVQADMKALFDDLVASDTELGHDARAARIAVMGEPD